MESQSIVYYLSSCGQPNFGMTGEGIMENPLTPYKGGCRMNTFNTPSVVEYQTDELNWLKNLFPKGDERKTFVGCHVGIRQSKKLCNEDTFCTENLSMLNSR